MPYINEKTKKNKAKYADDPTGGNDCAALRTLEENVNAIIVNIRTQTSSDRDGMCNYAISRIVAGSLKPSTGWRYKNLNRAYGTFLSAAAEFYHRLVRPYEEKCIISNGDLPEYQEE